VSDRESPWQLLASLRSIFQSVEAVAEDPIKFKRGRAVKSFVLVCSRSGAGRSL